MTNFTGFNQIPAEQPAKVQPEPLEVVFEERFQVQASSPNCKCVVTATGDVDGVRRVIPIHKCKGHDQVEQELAKAAHKRMQNIIAQWNDALEA